MKKIPILSNIFSRSRPCVETLETDAVPVDDPPDNNYSSSLDNTNNNQSNTSGDFRTALQLAESTELAMVRANSNSEVAEAPTGNTMTSITNTQAQLVMNFSNINGLHFGSVYNIESGALEQPPGKQQSASTTTPAKASRPRRTTTIEAMMKSSEELNHRMLDTISTHLGEGWKNVLRELNITHGQIEQSIIDNQMHGGIKEVIYQLLLDWIRNAEDGEATLGVITQILWKSGHRECVQKMKEAWKLENAARSA